MQASGLVFFYLSKLNVHIRRLYLLFFRPRHMTKSALWYGVVPGGACGMFDPNFTKPFDKTDVSDFFVGYYYEYMCFWVNLCV